MRVTFLNQGSAANGDNLFIFEIEDNPSLEEKIKFTERFMMNPDVLSFMVIAKKTYGKSQEPIIASNRNDFPTMIEKTTNWKDIVIVARIVMEEGEADYLLSEEKVCVVAPKRMDIDFVDIIGNIRC